MTRPRKTRLGGITRCPRCDYALKGLPSTHTCPECGLEFDENCALFVTSRPWYATPSVWIVGGIALLNIGKLENVFRLTGLSSWWEIEAFLFGVFFVFAILFIPWRLKHARIGYSVAITGSGLLLRLPNTGEKLIPWSQVRSADAATEDLHNVATLKLVDEDQPLQIGGSQCPLFENAWDSSLFVDEVNSRVGGRDREAQALRSE